MQVQQRTEVKLFCPFPLASTLGRTCCGHEVTACGMQVPAIGREMLYAAGWLGLFPIIKGNLDKQASTMYLC